MARTKKAEAGEFRNKIKLLLPHTWLVSWALPARRQNDIPLYETVGKCMETMESLTYDLPW